MKLLEGKSAVLTGIKDKRELKYAQTLAQNGLGFIFILGETFELAHWASIKISAQTGSNCKPIKVDLSDQEEVAVAVKIIKDEACQINMIVNFINLNSASENELNDLNGTEYSELENALAFSKVVLETTDETELESVINIAFLKKAIDEDKKMTNTYQLKESLENFNNQMGQLANSRQIRINSILAPQLISSIESKPKSYRIKESVYANEEELANMMSFLLSGYARCISGRCFEILINSEKNETQ